ncbi:macro domain-containing protein [Rubricoccus marinus]|uniref:O-acetyl-ADP-ribose deacetylase n=1 Tax=Rubricoccus marinus TaxID=716817 RepID=A0A259U3X7_9BACT|nr:O-acetyl-ADP-ribose deacetylase [Rubricoccus marinus]
MDAVLDLVRERVRARGGITGLWRGDITTLHVDVIVNAANRALAGGGGVDGAIQKAAGPELLAATLKIPEIRPAVRCPVGEAILTQGFKLPASHVAHAVGPVWRSGENGEPELLASAYRASLDLAAGVVAESIAFPAISTGAYGYPQWEAAQVAVQTCEAWRLANDPDMRILLVAFDDKTVKLLRSALSRFALR